MNDLAIVDWDAYAHDYDALNMLLPYGDMQQSVCDKILTYARDRTRILDAACGTGNLIGRLAQRFSAANRTDHLIVGLDRSPAMLARAKTKTQDNNICYIRANLDQDLPFMEGGFDVIASINALYALEDPSAVLKSFYAMLKDGGKLVLVTPRAGYENGLVLKAHCKSTKPNTYWEDAHASPEREQLLIKEAISDPGVQAQMLRIAAWNRCIKVEQKFHFYDPDELALLFVQIGFQIISIEPTYAGQNILVIASKERQHTEGALS